ncbi:hypothetical protein [Gelidibacter sp.]|uniref:hypothetical protein n=1 Tax=Gelidibacter sp. TaxID=2018083 RepID=UPI002BE125D4|nr:hypothetical protein [Gelidibacter sp.]HUH28932.1 hypothetical protein [Gelidibacter sp.]
MTDPLRESLLILIDMKWYSVILKRILKGILLFLVPVMLLLILIKKAVVLVRGLIEPLKAVLPEERFLGIGMLTLLTLFIILTICYLAGWRAELKGTKSFLPFFEEHILVLIPGYTLLKSSADEAIGDAPENWKAVLVDDDDNFKFGIEVERHADGYSTVFFPEPPDAKSGEMKIFKSSKLKPVDIHASKMIGIARKYGQGAASLLEKLVNEKGKGKN